MSSPAIHDGEYAFVATRLKAGATNTRVHLEFLAKQERKQTYLSGRGYYAKGETKPVFPPITNNGDPGSAEAEAWAELQNAIALYQVPGTTTWYRRDEITSFKSRYK